MDGDEAEVRLHAAAGVVDLKKERVQLTNAECSPKWWVSNWVSNHQDHLKTC